jgi:hypothetical protein
MSEQQHDETGSSQFEQRLRAALLDSSDALDGRTRSRLTQARYAALEQRAVPAPKSARWRGWAPAGAVAMAVLVTVLYIGHGGVNSPLAVPAGSSSALDDLDLLADSDALALSADTDQELDSDFYEWAAADGDAGKELGT